METSTVIEQYYQLRSCRAVAELYGCNGETIRRLLKSEGVALTGWKQKPKTPKKASTEDTKKQIKEAWLQFETYEEIANEVGVSIATVGKTLRDAGLGTGIGGNQIKQMKVTDEQILEDIALGLTRQEIVDKRGVHITTLDRRMKKLGVHAQYATVQKSANAKDWHYTAGAARLVEEHQGERFDFVSYRDRCYRLRCKKCGTVIERAASTIRKEKVRCEKCYETEQLNAALLVLVQRVATAYYSSAQSQKKDEKRKLAGIRRRCRHYGVTYAPGITLEKVYERDKGICRICGKPTDWHDNAWHDNFGPLYPTIDHINALANGGGHTWDNVQLAHAICNSYKRDLPIGEIKLA